MSYRPSFNITERRSALSGVCAPVCIFMNEGQYANESDSRKEMADVACQTTTKKDTKNGQTRAKQALYKSVCVHDIIARYVYERCHRLMRGYSSLGSTCYKVFSIGSLHKMFPLQPLLPSPPLGLRPEPCSRGPALKSL